MWVRKNAKFLFLVSATLGVAAAHFLVGTGGYGLHVLHIVLAGASLLIIVAGAIWYGWRGGVSVATATTVLYLAHVAVDWPRQPMENANQIAFAAIYLFVGAITGVLADLESREAGEKIEAEKAAQRIGIIRGLTALDQALGLRDGGTLMHSENVARLATQIARVMELPEDRIEDLRLASLTHDRGYPRGLEGVHISEEARILSVADVYCALIEERAYNEESRMTPAQALLFCESQAGLALDPAAVLVLRHLMSETPSPGSTRASPPDIRWWGTLHAQGA